MVFVLDIDYAPSVLTTADRFSAYDYVLLRSNDGKRDELLHLSVGCSLFFVVLLVVVWEHPQVVESKFLLNALLEGMTLFQG